MINDASDALAISEDRVVARSIALCRVTIASRNVSSGIARYPRDETRKMIDRSSSTEEPSPDGESCGQGLRVAAGKQASRRRGPWTPEGHLIAPAR